MSSVFATFVSRRAVAIVRLDTSVVLYDLMPLPYAVGSPSVKSTTIALLVVLVRSVYALVRPSSMLVHPFICSMDLAELSKLHSLTVAGMGVDADVLNCTVAMLVSTRCGWPAIAAVTSCRNFFMLAQLD
jgi:hypothetical protein